MNKYEFPKKSYPYPVTREKVTNGAFITLHRMGFPCYVRPEKICYVGPMIGATTSYTVVDGMALILDESVDTIMDMIGEV